LDDCVAAKARADEAKTAMDNVMKVARELEAQFPEYNQKRIDRLKQKLLQI
jgi:polyhydroxyalkanoate synthesis regulator phasin